MLNKKGFTLIELLVVIAIIALLSTLAVVVLSSTRKQANDAVRLSDIKEVRTALELYYTDKNSYPTTTNSGIMLGEVNTVCLNVGGFSGSGCATPYMPQIPRGPGSETNYRYRSTDGTSYVIESYLEKGAGNLQAGPIRVTPSEIKNS